eukprot:s6863_g1.t1
MGNCPVPWQAMHDCSLSGNPTPDADLGPADPVGDVTAVIDIALGCSATGAGTGFACPPDGCPIDDATSSVPPGPVLSFGWDTSATGEDFAGEADFPDVLLGGVDGAAPAPFPAVPTFPVVPFGAAVGGVLTGGRAAGALASPWAVELMVAVMALGSEVALAVLVAWPGLASRFWLSWLRPFGNCSSRLHLSRLATAEFWRQCIPCMPTKPSIVSTEALSCQVGGHCGDRVIWANVVLHTCF